MRNQLILAALLPLLSIACHSSSSTEAKDSFAISGRPVTDLKADSSAGVGLPEDQVPQPGSNAPGRQPQTAASSPVAANPDWDKKIIRSADLNIETKNFNSFSDRLHKAVRSSGGYIAQENQTQSSSAIENTVTIKVPVAQFEDLLPQLAADSDKIVFKKVGSEEVTTQVIDTRSRLETKKQVRERYLDLLKQAHDMNEILSVQNEINAVQQDMDAAAGRIAYLAHSAAYSTINLRFYQVLPAQIEEEPAPSFFNRIGNAIAIGWTWISALLVGLVSVWPLWIAAGGIWLFLRRRGWTTAKKTQPPVA